MSILRPAKEGDLTITRLAGKFTPEDKVDVATITFKMFFLKAPSIISRSSIVSPKKLIFFFIQIVALKEI